MSGPSIPGVLALALAPGLGIRTGRRHSRSIPEPDGGPEVDLEVDVEVDEDGDIDIEVGEDAAWVAAALVLVAALGGAVVLADWPLWGVEGGERSGPQLVEPADNGTGLWPYTSSRSTFGSRTLGINVVFFGDPADLRTALTRRSELEWEEERIHEGDADGDTISEERVKLDPNASNLSDIVEWDRAEGSTR
jgi:hypothetical protein